MTLRSRYLFLFFITSILFTHCTSKKTEREQYEDATSGITYTTYKATSKLTIAATIKTYNYQQPDSLDLKPEYAHLLLGYFWAISGKSKLSFAEADITEESDETNLKFLAQSMRSITMYQEGWHALAKEESVKAREGLSKNPGTSVTYEAAVFYLIMGTVYVKEKDFAQASFFWAGFGNETGIHWPYQLSDAASDFQSGKTQQGLQKVKIISQDPAVPKPLRDALKTEIEKIEKLAGTSVDSSLFWPKIITNLVWEELQKSADGSLHNLTRLVNEAKEKLPV